MFFSNPRPGDGGRRAGPAFGAEDRDREMDKKQRMKRLAKGHAEKHGMSYQAALQQLRGDKQDTPTQRGPRVGNRVSVTRLLRELREEGMSEGKVVAAVPRRVWIAPCGEGIYVPFGEASLEDLEHHFEYFTRIEGGRSPEETLREHGPDLSEEQRAKVLSCVPPVSERTDDTAVFEDGPESVMVREEEPKVFHTLEEWIDTCVASRSKTLMACSCTRRRLLGYRTEEGEVFAVRLSTVRDYLAESLTQRRLHEHLQTPKSRAAFGEVLARAEPSSISPVERWWPRTLRVADR